MGASIRPKNAFCCFHMSILSHNAMHFRASDLSAYSTLCNEEYERPEISFTMAKSYSQHQ